MALCYFWTMTTYLMLIKFPHLQEKEVKERMGAAYETLAVKRGSRLVVLAVVLNYLRRLALCVVITFGRDSPEV